MDDGTNALIIGLGIIVSIIGAALTIKRILKIKRNRMIIGEIYDRRSGYQDHYFPVIKYEIDGTESEYISHHYSVFQRIGSKVKLLIDIKKNCIIGTLSELFYIPVILLIIGLFLVGVMILYYLIK